MTYTGNCGPLEEEAHFERAIREPTSLTVRYPIRSQVLLIVAATLVATIAATSILTAMLNARRAVRELQHQHERILAVVQASGFPLTNSTLQQMQGLSGAEFALTDRTGRGVAASQALANAALPPAGMEGSRDASPLSVGGIQYLRRAVPVFRSDHSSPLFLHVLYPEANIIAARREASIAPLLGGAFGSLLALVLSGLLARRIARPTIALAQRMKHISDEGYPQLPVPTRDDEIRDLVIVANQLSLRISDLTATVRRSERLAIVGQLGGGMAHQLRNAAAGARLAVQLHQRTCADRDRECLNNAVRQLDLIEEQVACLLSVGKPAAVEFSPVNLADVLCDVLELIEPTCRHRRIAMESSVPADAITLLGQYATLRHLVLNLLLNAIDAAQNRVAVGLELDAERRVARLTVSDDGPGVPHEVAQQIFEPFFTSKPEGIGLGLTVAKQVAESHRARLWCERLGSETVFVFEAPLAQAEPSTMAPGVLAS